MSVAAPDRESSAASDAAAILRVTSGNFLEMFDFFLFGFFAKPIGDAFFPVGDPVARVLLVFVTFGAGFLMRPLGAILLGAYVDRAGRRKGLIVTLAIMASGTIVIAATPSFATLKTLSPSLAYLVPAAVLLGRLAQGFSAGVELGGVSVYLAELAPPGRGGFYASWQSASQQVAIMAAATIGYALRLALTPEKVAAFGWRIPFVIGCAIVPAIFVIRRRLEETSPFLARGARPRLADVLGSIRHTLPIILIGAAMVAMTTVSFYLITVYTPTFGRKVLKLDEGEVLIVTFAVGLSNFFWLPVVGALSDRIGRRPILVAAPLLALATAYPTLAFLVAAPTFEKMLAAELWLSFLYAAYNGAMIIALSEIVPAEARTTGFSLAYSLATAVFGGFTPALSEALIAWTGDKASPGIWMTTAAAISLIAALAVRPKPFKPSGRR